MRLLIQRVKRAKVTVEDAITGQIGPGLLVFFGVKKDDSESAIDYLVNRLINLRMFRDENDKMNLSVLDNQLSILVVSQFTLYADCTSGRRPSFTNSETPDRAEKLYNEFVSKLKNHLPVETGIFGAKMEVELINDGPVTFIVDSKE